MASDMDKPDGLFLIKQEEIAKILDPLPVGRLWGIGKMSLERLSLLGIKTIAELKCVDIEILKPVLGSWAETAKNLALGIDPRQVNPDKEQAKSVGSENTFSKNIRQLDKLVCILWNQVDEISSRLRALGLRGKTIQVKARYADFKTITRSETLENNTASTLLIGKTAENILRERVNLKNSSLRLLGVSISKLSTEKQEQLDLFNAPGTDKDEELDKQLDKIRNKYGKDKIGRGNLKEIDNEEK
jgi:DNA polymerase-4